MKKILFGIVLFCNFSVSAQTKYQLSLGVGQNFLQQVNMKTGEIGLSFKQDKSVYIDLNKQLKGKQQFTLGIKGTVNFASYWFELNKAVPYYSVKPHIPIFDFESVEMMLYLKKYLVLHNADKFKINSFAHAGLCFNIGYGNSGNATFGLRDDNPNQDFQISNIDIEAQKVYIPYFRITGGVELFTKIGKRHWIGISPFISWAGLQSDKNKLTVLPEDATYISTGDFKRNRSGYGVRVIFAR